MDTDCKVFQTRSEETGMQFHRSLQEAFDAAAADPTIWKVSWEGNRLVRVLDEPDNWRSESMEEIISCILEKRTPSVGEAVDAETWLRRFSQ